MDKSFIQITSIAQKLSLKLLKITGDITKTIKITMKL